MRGLCFCPYFGREHRREDHIHVEQVELPLGSRCEIGTGGLEAIEEFFSSQDAGK